MNDLNKGLSLEPGPEEDNLVRLKTALETGDDDQALGAFRLLEAIGRDAELGLDQWYGISAVFERAGLHLEAARALRAAAEKDLGHPRTPEFLLRTACLLIGPAHRPEPGVKLLEYLVSDYAQTPQGIEADEVLESWHAEDGSGLKNLLARHGVSMEPPVLPVPSRPAAAVPETTGAQPDVAPAQGRLAGLTARLLPWYRSAGYRRLARASGIVFGLALISLVVSHYTRDRLSGVDQVASEVFGQPRQTRLAGDPVPIQFERQDLLWTLTPRYDYDISGLIVSKNDYSFLGLSRKEFFRMDLCLIWGGNARRRVFDRPGIEFSQHSTVCWVHYRSGVGFSGNELANTHIISEDADLQSKFASLRTGDQVRIRGQLVDARGVPKGREGFYMSNRVDMKTSVTRTDKGMGACEIMHVDDLQVLAEANPWTRRLHTFSLFIVVLLALVFAARLVLLPVGLRSR